MAFVLVARGNLEEAVEYAVKSSEILEKHEKVMTEMVLIYQYDHASILYYAGRDKEALELHTSVLEHRLKMCGPSAQYTLESLETVAILYFLVGNLDLAG